MTQSIIHTSENGNFYLYDDQNRLSVLMHPEFVKAYKGITDADQYYLKKYAYLMEHGFFAKPKLTDFISMHESVVRENIINARQIVFEATDSCNLNCTYCALGEFYEGHDERIGKKIKTHYAINLLKYIFDLKPKDKNNRLVISFYGGEALLNMTFIKRIVEVANQLNAEKMFNLQYSMTTNATMIHQHIDFLVANKFTLLISLDGNEENHSYRLFNDNKRSSFRKVIDNMDMIQRDYPDYFFDHIIFNSVLHNRNSVKEIYKYIYARYQKIPRIAELNLRDVRPDNKEILKEMFHSKWKSEAEYQMVDSDLLRITHNQLSSYTELRNFLKYFSINFYMSHMNALLLADEKYLPTNTCTPFSKKIFLTNRNKLLPCEKMNYKYFLGKVNDHVEINIPEIARQYNFYYEHIKKHCQNCYIYRFCGTCLFHLNNIDHVNKGEFFCENFHDQKRFKNKLHRIFSFFEKYPNDFSEIIENVIIE